MNKLYSDFLKMGSTVVSRPRDIFAEIAKVLNFDIRDFPADPFGMSNGITCDAPDGGQYSLNCRTRMNKDTPAPSAHFTIVHANQAGIRKKQYDMDIDFTSLGLTDEYGDARRWNVSQIDDSNSQTGKMLSDYRLNRCFVDWMKANAPRELQLKFADTIKGIRAASTQRIAKRHRDHMLRS